MQVQILGPVQIRVGDVAFEVGPPQRCVVFAALAANAGQMVLQDTLIDRVWGPAPSRGARRTVQTHIANIRSLLKRIGTSAQMPVVRRGGGYVFDVDPDLVDVHRFRRLAAQAVRARRGSAQRVVLWREAVGRTTQRRHPPHPRPLPAVRPRRRPGSASNTASCSRLSTTPPPPGTTPTRGSWPGTSTTSLTGGGIGATSSQPRTSPWPPPNGWPTPPGRSAPTACLPASTFTCAVTTTPKPSSSGHSTFPRESATTSAKPMSGSPSPCCGRGRDRNAEALRHAQIALDLFVAAGHQAGHAAALNAVGWYHALLGEHQQALTCCEQALTMLQANRDRPGEGRRLGQPRLRPPSPRPPQPGRRLLRACP